MFDAMIIFILVMTVVAAVIGWVIFGATGAAFDLVERRGRDLNPRSA